MSLPPLLPGGGGKDSRNPGGGGGGGDGGKGGAGRLGVVTASAEEGASWPRKTPLMAAGAVRGGTEEIW